MKNIVLIVLIALFACSCNSRQGETKQTATDAAIVANKTINLAIEGMSCTGCENTIKEAVSTIVGVTAVKASYQASEAIVKYDSTKTDLKAISDVITEAGYIVKGEKSLSAEPPSAN
jgi:copper chaperone CopZ